ncbi:hypothetical protein X975_18409, partial [Stegodyphus mimosarum]
MRYGSALHTGCPSTSISRLCNSMYMSICSASHIKGLPLTLM